MEGGVMSSHLKSKLSSILDEAEADPFALPMMSRFRIIEHSINSVSKESRSSSAAADASEAESMLVDVLYDLIDVVLECRILAHRQQKAAASKKGFFRFITVNPLINLVSKRNMRRRMDNIEHRLQDARFLPMRGVPEIREITYASMNASQIIGLESQVKEIVAALLEPRRLIDIGIVGRYGCGKTALAQMVFNHPEIEQVFSPRVWVCLSNITMSDHYKDDKLRILAFLTPILREMVRSYDSSYEVKASDDLWTVLRQLESELHHRIRGGKYLIVLDDAWELVAETGKERVYGNVNDIIYHYLPPMSGGATIMASRREDVIHSMVWENVHMIRMEPRLSNEMCWQIFSNAVRDELGMRQDDHLPAGLMQMKDDIIRKCDGLPLAAKTLATVIPPLLH